MERGKELGTRHALLVRSAIMAVVALQRMGADDATPGHMKLYLLQALEYLERGLRGAPVTDERVVIEVSGGVARVVAKSEHVEVVIRYYGGEA